MFKTAAAKLAHNSTIPALAGNQELRPLQDLISAEKAVIISLQKLSVDFSKASEALRTWGLSEGDDLGDILGGSATVLNHFSAALSQYAAHGHGMREQLKALRTREESLDEMKRRRRTVFRKADDADKKLSKMGPEHKNLPMQTDLLNRLRDEIRMLDTDIMVEEAALGDFKRTATKLYMGTKFGGLMECCQKGSIAANFGNMIVAEISEEKTQPGLHRAFYQGHPKTENLVTEAQHAVSDVSLSTIPTLAFRDRRQYYNGREGPSNPFQGEKPMPIVPGDSSDYSELSPPTRTFVDVPPSPQSYSSRQNLNVWSQTPTEAPPIPLTKERSSLDDFGTNLGRSSTGPIDSHDGPSARFATFPVKGRPAAPSTFTLDPFQSSHDLGPSFALSIADALEHKDNPDHNGTASSAPQSLPLPSAQSSLSVATNHWADPTGKSSGTQKRESNLSDNDDALLAYMMSGDDAKATQESLQITEKNGLPKAQPREEVPNPELKADKRISVEDKPQPVLPSVAGITVEREDGSSKVYEVPSNLETRTSKSETEPLATSQSGSEGPEEQEKALNVAAAQEIRLELEALKASPPNVRSSLPSDTVERGRLPAGAGQVYGSFGAGRDHSPLAPPSAPFTRRSVSPYPEMNFIPSPGAAGHSYGPPHGLGGPSSVSFSQPQESQYSPRPQGLSPGQVYHPSRLQSGTSPLSGSPAIDTPSLNSSLNISGGPARTISAAAFKKPRKMSMDSLSKGPPGSPYPVPGGGGPRIFSAPAIPPGSPSYVSPSQQLDNRLSQAGSEYDYIDDYLQPNSPHRPEFGRDSSLPRADGGYQTGKFSTDLEDSPLR